MRVWPLILAVLLLTACAGAPSTGAGDESALVRLEDGDAAAVEPAMRLLAAHPGDAALRERLAAALRGVPLRRSQVEAAVAPVAPDLARDLVEERTTRLAVTGDSAQPVAELLARTDDWITPVAAGDAGAAVIRIRRLPAGDAFELVLDRRRQPPIDAIRRLDCGDAACIDRALAETGLILLRQ